MEDYGFRLITRDEALQLGLPEGSGLFSELYTNMMLEIKQSPNKKNDYGGSSKMNEFEKKISFLNRYFVYKKIRNVNAAKVVLETPEEELEIESKISTKKKTSDGEKKTRVKEKKTGEKKTSDGEKKTGEKKTSVVKKIKSKLPIISEEKEKEKEEEVVVEPVKEEEKEEKEEEEKEEEAVVEPVKEEEKVATTITKKPRKPRTIKSKTKQSPPKDVIFSEALAEENTD